MSTKVFISEDSTETAPVNYRSVQASGGTMWRPEGNGAASGEAIAQIRLECAQQVQDAHAAGIREGEANGRRLAAAELEPLMARLCATIEELAVMRARLRHEAEADLVKLALAIARRILRRELSVDPDALGGLVMSALDKLQGQEIVRVRVHPAQAAPVTVGLRKSPAGASVEVVSDPSREPGTIIFETARGNLDASMESQLLEIERGLADRLRRHSS
jgi:flagellar assembly protein FliH